MKYYVSSYLTIVNGVLWTKPLSWTGLPQQPLQYDDQEEGDVVIDENATVAKLVKGVWTIQYTKPSMVRGTLGYSGPTGGSGLYGTTWPQRTNIVFLRGEPEYGVNTWGTTTGVFIDLLTGKAYEYDYLYKKYKENPALKINLVRTYG